ncbi:hypothetical protein MCOR27_004626 [Pyricularia oryzae]|uniref:Uncharacterized protein n=4 Tax=Pyricularia TaxID=48558 RepID=A0ABQ8NLX9_PYRGI|nr:hypothetical protein OOU_Y34scaffold01005g10 [Pyricularia oryzae Y34]KAI6252155.1 hypothetical protein MCOR19_011220 [Pyricularia oryzae]KAI6299024.1 hypothetical protein MCOR33_004971 [Pyricularia grisea]KAI6280539.1 hypothetical protein MCOR27_004626 [Pyricularia oryzae]KAI6288217.1 hypothetical protein MCOR26_000225 [Pyricularia oryzae]
MGCCCSKPKMDEKRRGKQKATVMEEVVTQHWIPYDPSSDSGEFPPEECWPAPGEAGPSDWRERRKRERRRAIDQANRRRNGGSSSS